MSNIFGWSYPAGAENDPNAPWNQEEGPCEICGRFSVDCICPECPTCECVGDPTCYKEHGLVRTKEQIDSLANAESQWEQEAREDEEYARSLVEENL